MGWLAEEVVGYSHKWNTVSIGTVYTVGNRSQSCLQGVPFVEELDKETGHYHVWFSLLVFCSLAACHTRVHLLMLGFLKACLWVPFTLSTLCFELSSSSESKCHLTCGGSQSYILAQTWLVFLICTSNCPLHLDVVSQFLQLNMSRTGLSPLFSAFIHLPIPGNLVSSWFMSVVPLLSVESSSEFCWFCFQSISWIHSRLSLILSWRTGCPLSLSLPSFI